MNYIAPKCSRGDVLACEFRGEDVRVGGLTDAKIPWPYAMKSGRRSLILCGDLIRAVRQEAELDICDWFGVSVVTVWKWRKSLGVGRVTPGSSKRLAGNAEAWRRTEECADVLRKNLQDPLYQFRAVLRAMTPRAAPETTRKVLLKYARKPWTEERKARRSATMAAKIRRGELPKPPAPGRPWTAKEDSLLGVMVDSEVAKRIDRTLAAVRSRRRELGIAACRHAKLYQTSKPHPTPTTKRIDMTATKKAKPKKKPPTTMRLTDADASAIHDIQTARPELDTVAGVIRTLIHEERRRSARKN